MGKAIRIEPTARLCFQSHIACLSYFFTLWRWQAVWALSLAYILGRLSEPDCLNLTDGSLPGSIECDCKFVVDLAGAGAVFLRWGL